MTGKLSLFNTAAAFAQPMWMRHRKAYAMASAICLVAIVFTYFAPSLFGLTGLRAHNVGAVVGDLVAGIVFLECYTLASKVGTVFAIERGRISSGVFTKSMLVLPVKTRDLVLLPMAVCTASVVLFWLVFCFGAAIPLKLNIPIVGPLLVLVLTTVSSQTSSWTILSNPILGVLLTVGSSFFAYFAFFGWLGHVPMIWLYSILCLGIAGCLWINVHVGPNARHSISSRPMNRRKSLRVVAEPNRQARDSKFRTSLAAQVWFELRPRLYLMVPVFTAIACLVLLGRILLSTDALDRSIGIGSITIGPRTVQYLFSFPISFGIYMLGVPSTFTKSFMNPQFVMLPGRVQFMCLRPISTWRQVFAVQAGTVRSALLSSLVLWTGALLCLMAPAKEGAFRGSLGQMLLPRTSTRELTLALLAALLTPAVMMSLQFGNPLYAIFSRKLAQFLTAIPSGLALISAVPLVIFAIIPDRDVPNLTTSYPELLDVGRSYALTIGVILVFFKAVFVYEAMKRHIAKRLASPIRLAQGACVWAAVGIALTAVFAAVLPSGLISLLGLSLIVVLALPANRILWQVLALDAVRHQ